MSIEAVIALPILLLSVFACVQLSIGWYGRAALEAAAQDTLAVYQTNATGHTWADPDTTARDSMRRNAGFVGHISHTVVELGDGRVRVTVHGQVLGMFPGSTRTIDASVIGTLDNFRPQGEP